jgi:hypothetical protein
MIEAKDCLRPLSSCLAACLAMSLIVLGPGCANMGGLRSIGTGWPSLHGFWDRSGPGSPLPENDTYAQGMHGNTPAVARNGAEKPAAKDESKDAAPAGSEKDPASPGQRAIEPAPADRAAQRSGRSRRSGADDGIKVTLGKPEPLPGLAAETPPPALAEATGPPQWKADESGQEAASVTVAAASGARDAPGAPAPPGLEEPAQPPDAPQADPDVLLAAAQAKLDKLKTYQVSITRQERVDGRLQPEEELLLSIRREPRAVRLEWTVGPSKGREVIYSSATDPHMLFVHQPGAALVLPSMKISVDSPLVMKNSRHKITEAGFEAILENLRRAQKSGAADPPAGGRLQYKGLVTPDGIDQTCHHFVRRPATGQTWDVYLDSRSMLPRLVLAEDSRGELLERYVYGEVHEDPAELASGAAFEPEKRWGESNGLLSRLARAASGGKAPSAGTSTTR